MSQEILIERLFDALISGDRHTSRAVLDETLMQGVAAEKILTDLFWPVYERIETFHRHDQMTTLSHHLATRLLRVLVDQTALRLRPEQKLGRRVFAVCGPTDADELAAQMAIDLLESKGFAVQFAGGGIAMDEVLARVQEQKPEHLVLFASAPQDLPEIRGLIDTLKEIGACTASLGAAADVQVVVGGGVFNRADGLAEEIGADLWANTPAELVQAMCQQPDRRACETQRTVGKNKSGHKRRVA